jgi:uncharacterized protein YjeT (DUF2065 family)
MTDLWAALALVLVLEGLFLFAAPAAWRRAVRSLIDAPDGRLRRWGGGMLLAGLVALWVVRG